MVTGAFESSGMATNLQEPRYRADDADGRLTSLTEEGLLEKRRHFDHPPRDEYVLTKSGRDFLPVLFAIAVWGAMIAAEAR
ncbi:HxlR family transcriptional regulator [Rhizobium azibense]|uniref:HxlR family transcriptional regulator n=1 Tax=Rhizobium azibense TaxID=1136135 RepID=A0A4R3RT90_9HYPH|nr:HxlR family transcriptional regulator [Rhizobium azibense]TCU38007.1 HxlR family transcriptional regulator [Rhizobium azibense]